MRKTALATATLLALTACGSDNDEPEPLEVQPDADYDSVEDLREAAEESGASCDSDEPTDRGDHLLAIDCGSEMTLVWAEDRDGMPEQLSDAALIHQDVFLVSDNWFITGPDPEPLVELQDSMGGELVEPSPIQQAHERCQREDALEYDPDYEVISLSGAFHITRGNATSAFECLVSVLPIPSFVQNDIERTRALDGTRDADWDEFSASWTYHPDSGLNIQIRYIAD